MSAIQDVLKKALVDHVAAQMKANVEQSVTHQVVNKALDAYEAAELKFMTDAARSRLQQLQIDDAAQKAFRQISFQTAPDNSFGTQLKRLAFGSLKGPQHQVVFPWRPLNKAAMAETSGTTGGYTVAPTHEDEIPVPGEEPIIRPRARVRPCHTATSQRPFWTVTTAQSAGTSPMFGGLYPTWNIEGAQLGESEPLNSMLELQLWLLGFLLIGSNAWLADASSGEIEAQLALLIQGVITAAEEYAFFQGSGAGQPLGILNSGAVIKVTRQTGNAITYQDYSTMLSKLLPESTNRAVGVCSPTALPNLMQLRDGTVRAVAIGTQSAGGRPQLAIGHLPLYVTEKLPALGTYGDFAIIDPWWYDIADHATLEQQEQGIYRSINIYKSDNTPQYFTKNQSAFIVYERVDGRPRIDRPITAQDGSTQVSPFVVLN
jgi:HK97 family phage major capsid protein